MTTENPSPAEAVESLLAQATAVLIQHREKIADLRAARDKINDELRALVAQEPMLARAVKGLTPRTRKAKTTKAGQS